MLANPISSSSLNLAYFIVLRKHFTFPGCYNISRFAGMLARLPPRDEIFADRGVSKDNPIRDTLHTYSSANSPAVRMWTPLPYLYSSGLARVPLPSLLRNKQQPGRSSYLSIGQYISS